MTGTVVVRVDVLFVAIVVGLSTVCVTVFVDVAGTVMVVVPGGCVVSSVGI